MRNAIKKDDGNAVRYLRLELAKEFGRQRNWKRTRAPFSIELGLDQLIRRGKIRTHCASAYPPPTLNLDHNTWYKNSDGELIGVVTQPYAPIICNDPRLKITEPNYPKWHAPDNPRSHFYLIEPVATQSIRTYEVANYIRAKELRAQGTHWRDMTTAQIESTYKIACEWQDAAIRDDDDLAVEMVHISLSD